MPEPTLAQGMILIGFGAAIGSITTYVAALTQSRFQKKHMLLEKKVGGLVELSRSIVNGAEVLHQIELFKQQLKSATDDAGRSRATERLMDLANSSNHWQAEISAQTTLIQALFGDPKPIIPSSPGTEIPDVSIPSANEDFRAMVKTMLDDCEHNIYESMRAIEMQIVLRARQLQ